MSSWCSSGGEGGGSLGLQGLHFPLSQGGGQGEGADERSEALMKRSTTDGLQRYHK